VAGRWGSWSSWTSCSVTCGGGQRTRQRACDNPPPSGGGADCSGSSNQQQSCSSTACRGKLGDSVLIDVEKKNYLPPFVQSTINAAEGFKLLSSLLRRVIYTSTFVYLYHVWCVILVCLIVSGWSVGNIWQLV